MVGYTAIGEQTIRHSDTYLAIIEEGQMAGSIAEVKKMILRFGQKSWGPPDEGTKAALAIISDLDRLEPLHDRILDVTSWQELLATP